MTDSHPTPISLTYGAVRVGTVTTWDEACANLRKQISGTYRPNGAMSWLNATAIAREAHELAQVDAPVNGMICTAGSWTWGDSIRAAQEGERGLTAGDLAILHDYPNGHYGWWSVNVLVKILSVGTYGGRPTVTVRITDRSASQFDAGQVITVSATAIRRRNASGRR
jgi:hypothetical protein